MSAQRLPPVLLKPSRSSKILALVPNEHAPSDASENSDSETEMHGDPRAYASSPLSSSAPSITSSLANLAISTSEDEESNTDNIDVISDSILREIGECNYENVPSLSAIPSLPSTPAPVASSSPLASRNTRSRKQPPTIPAKRAKKGKKFQLAYKWKVAQFRHRATVEEHEDGEIGAETVLLTDKAMKKKPRGNFVQAVCNQNRLAIVRWNDNKAVTFISSFVASEPVEKIRRYCKDAKCKIDVKCPQIVRQYNKHMGGVDLADMLISLYKTPFKSRRWYLAIFSQMLDICVNNAWLLYRRKHSSNAKAKIPLKAFRYDVYEILLKANRCAKRNKTETAKVGKPHVARPSSPVKYDNIGHFPSTMEEGRCRYCQKKTVVYCIKCNTRLCFVTGKTPRNCFLNFHTK